jgi:hypothetical protein
MQVRSCFEATDTQERISRQPPSNFSSFYATTVESNCATDERIEADTPKITMFSEARLTIAARVSYSFPSFRSTIESNPLGTALSSSNSGAVVHRNVAVIACDTGVTLKETLHRLEDIDVDAVQIGERHLVLPARQVGSILDRLREHGQFPKLVGKSLAAKEREQEEEEEEENDTEEDE